MRIRSIRPEFWSSEDVAATDWHTRLVYIGLWSYVDDNGVGRDKERLIVASLFPLDEDLPESSRRVTGALRHLSDGGQITRYTVDGKPYLHVTAWTKHQRIEKASKGRYPLPTCENAEITEDSPTTPGTLPEMSTLGEGEKGRRGEGEKNSSSSADADAEFAKWWSFYPRKVGKGAAAKAYRAARKKTDADTLGRAMVAQIPLLIAKGADFCPHAATWLNGERWLDEIPASDNVRYLPSGEPDPASLPPVEDTWMRRRRSKP